MGKSVNIQLSKFETLQLFNDGERIHVIRINESGNQLAVIYLKSRLMV